jgi:DNA-binding NarL/FixJ family response regulator
MIRVLLADDHLLLRQGTRALLQQAADIEIVAETEKGEDVITLVGRLHPDVVLLDIRLHGLSGVDVARALRQDWPEVKIIMLTAYHYEQYVRALFAIGVDGYLLKNASGTELIEAVRAVQRGEQVLSKEIVSQLSGRTQASGIAATGSLTDREQEVLVMVSQGASNKEIAKNLNISSRTVETYVSNVMAKLGAHSRTEAISLALQRGILAPRE